MSNPDSAATLAQDAAPDPLSADHLRWRRTVVWTTCLLVVWLVVTVAAAFFARSLSARIFGWPFSFWFGAQGALLVFLAIVWIYARAIDRVERDPDA